MTTSAQSANRTNNKNDESRTTTATSAAAGTVPAATTITTDNTCIAVQTAALASPNIQHHPHGMAQMITASVTTATATTATVTSASTNRVMQADEDFNIRFVNLVRTHRCLYDKKVPEYRNRDNQEKAWALISQETRESVIHCKERWRNLRACLSRYIKQQSGAEPQHKPYYLTEHMAFLLPFLKSARALLEGNNNLTDLFQLAEQQQQQQQQQHDVVDHQALHLLTAASQLHLQHSTMEFKQSLSENDDEETIDAFDPAITASLSMQRAAAVAATAAVEQQAEREHCGSGISPALSDTASANTLQNFIPDVQLAESATDLVYVAPSHNSHHNHHHHHPQTHLRRDSRDYDGCASTNSKRIKTECEATSGQYFGLMNGEQTDMEFFRSILPDIAALTALQKRKLKIGILQLIDDVIERFPANGIAVTQERACSSGNLYNGMTNGLLSNGIGSSSGQQRRSSARDSWRK